MSDFDSVFMLGTQKQSQTFLTNESMVEGKKIFTELESPVVFKIVAIKIMNLGGIAQPALVLEYKNIEFLYVIKGQKATQISSMGYNDIRGLIDKTISIELYSTGSDDPDFETGKRIVEIK